MSMGKKKKTKIVTKKKKKKKREQSEPRPVVTPPPPKEANKYSKAARGILGSINKMAMYLGGATLVQADEYRQDNVETEGDEQENEAAAAGQVRQDRSLIGPLAQLK